MTNRQNPDRRSMMQRLAAPETEAPPWGWLDTTNTISVLLIATIFIGQLIALILVGDINDASVNAEQTLIVGWIFGALLTILFAYITRLRSPESRMALGLGVSSVVMPFAMLMGIAAALTANLVAGLAGGAFHPIAELILVFRNGTSSGLWIMVIPFLLILQPISEEIVFRGMLLRRARYSLGPWAGVGVSVVVNGVFVFVVYGVALQGNASLWYGVVLPLLMSLFYSVFYVHTGSLRATIAARMGASVFWMLAATVLQV